MIHATHNSPDSRIVLPYYAAAAILFLAANLLLIFHYQELTAHYYQPLLLGIIHLIVLGFITTIIWGVLYQLLPVIFQTKLKSELLARINLLLHVCGTLLLTGSFLRPDLPPWIQWSGGLFLAFSVGVFGLNVLLTFFLKPEITIERLFILTSVGWLFVTLIFGLLMILNKYGVLYAVPHHLLLPVHIFAGLAGWVLQLIIGVSAVLFPLFLLNHGIDKRLLKWIYISLNSGLVTGIAGHLTEIYSLKIAGIALITISVALYLLFTVYLFRKRLKRTTDDPMRFSLKAYWFFGGIVLLFTTTLFFGNIIGETNLFKLFVALFLFGFVSTLIYGQTFKTLPFIVWLKCYKTLVGKHSIPLPKELYNEQLVRLQYYAHLSGICLLLPGIATGYPVIIFSGTLLMLTGAILYCRNTLRLIFHKSVRYDNN